MLRPFHSTEINEFTLTANGDRCPWNSNVQPPTGIYSHVGHMLLYHECRHRFESNQRRPLLWNSRLHHVSKTFCHNFKRGPHCYSSMFLYKMAWTCVFVQVTGPRADTCSTTRRVFTRDQNFPLGLCAKLMCVQDTNMRPYLAILSDHI